MNLKIRPLLTGLAGVLTMLGVNALCAAETPNDAGVRSQETAPARDARMQWFRDAKFGMFIHWGLSSQLAGEWQGQTITGGAEWIQESLGIPSSQYSALVKTWNPTNYDARQCLRLCICGRLHFAGRRSAVHRAAGD
jgi:alpha-L-fucosidase